FSFTALPITNEENFYIKKSYVYAIIGSFDKNREYEIGRENSLGVLVDLLMYAEENFCEKCFLKDVARKLGYDYAYLSKIFKRNTTLSFNSYVNTLRINKSKIMLEKTGKSVTQIADECGYSSLRSFNRAFIRAEGQTPSQYKNVQKDRKF
ncbi:MAG: helix-turn-helix transcriptional regulator, partial [Clostridia bacterium]|nr:helix-turn-helix transcriptional regulator [Clostridia bacterium]